MIKTATLSCKCGEVRGSVTNVSRDTVNRIVCYCDDRQAFLHHLGRAELLDAQGGTDLVQIAPASLSFMQGTERIAGLRLSPNGLYRWYASCCKTPAGRCASAPNLDAPIGVATHELHDPQGSNRGAD